MLEALWADADAIAAYFRSVTGVEPITVIPTRTSDPGPTVWSIYTDIGTFYIVDGRYREMFRRGRPGPIGRNVCRSAAEAMERYLNMHPDEAARDRTSDQ